MRVITFLINDSLFGVDITMVKELYRNIQYTPIPCASKCVIGLLNLRGQVVTLLDLASLIGYADRPSKERNLCIILKKRWEDDDIVGFTIDEPGDVIDLEDGDIQPPPANIRDMDNQYLAGVAKLKDRLLLILDMEKIIE
ncbi:MAG TPA: purine-binding chemotaxis protein CheW [Clostridiales bacterium]|nr:purine-binding chemotaxis protein CheW [Clostridiales bacterium]